MAPKFKSGKGAVSCKKRPSACKNSESSSRPSAVSQSLDAFPANWRDARAMFSKLSPTLDIKVPHSVQHPKTLKWKSLSPDQLRQVIQRRQAHMAGDVKINEWAQHARVPVRDEVGAAYFFWCYVCDQHHVKYISCVTRLICLVAWSHSRRSENMYVRCGWRYVSNWI